ncbi:unnamed protein product, partial [Polarella glacialis]
LEVARQQLSEARRGWEVEEKRLLEELHQLRREALCDDLLAQSASSASPVRPGDGSTSSQTLVVQHQLACCTLAKGKLLRATGLAEASAQAWQETSRNSFAASLDLEVKKEEVEKLEVEAERLRAERGRLVELGNGLRAELRCQQVGPPVTPPVAHQAASAPTAQEKVEREKAESLEAALRGLLRENRSLQAEIAAAVPGAASSAADPWPRGRSSASKPPAARSRSGSARAERAVVPAADPCGADAAAGGGARGPILELEGHAVQPSSSPRMPRSASDRSTESQRR